MKTLKLNLLEKKEMNEVRGGTLVGPGSYTKCACVCVEINGHTNENAMWKEDRDKTNPSTPSIIFRKG